MPTLFKLNRENNWLCYNVQNLIFNPQIFNSTSRANMHKLGETCTNCTILTVECWPKIIFTLFISLWIRVDTRHLANISQLGLHSCTYNVFRLEVHFFPSDWISHLVHIDILVLFGPRKLLKSLWYQFKEKSV